MEVSSISKITNSLSEILLRRKNLSHIAVLKKSSSKVLQKIEMAGLTGTTKSTVLLTHKTLNLTRRQ
jgi:hypothetical protein